MTTPTQNSALKTQNSNSPLTAYQLFFDLQALDPLHLHAHNGSALRGMLYRAVRELADGNHRAPDLHFMDDPVLQRLLATLDEDSPRGRDVPRPYVIEPPTLPPTSHGDVPPKGEKITSRSTPISPLGAGGDVGGGHILAPGEEFTFGITLFGEAMEAFPYIVMAMKHAEMRGLGRYLLDRERPSRGRFRVVRAFAQNPLTRTTQEFLAPGERMVMTPQVCITDDDVMRQTELDAGARSSQLRVHFHTPATLKSQGKVIHEPRFNVLIHRLIERLTQISQQFGDGLLPCLPADREAKNALLKLADAVQLIDNCTCWMPLRGWSDRTHAPTNLSGLVGTADYAADDFAPFFSILRWGEFIHAGNHAVKGNGLFRVQPL